MDYTDLIHICTDLECLKAEGIEAQTEEQGDVIQVRCGLCGRIREYPKEALDRESTALIEENLRGYFRVEERYVKND